MRQASRLMLAGLALGVAVTGGGVVWSHLASQRAIALLERYSVEPGRFDAAGLALDQARLYAAALETLAGAPPVLLRQRYEAFVASIARIRGDEWRVHFASLPRFEETLVQLDALVARIDDLLGTSASVPGAAMPQAAVIELTRLLPPLREPLADLALAFDAATSVQVVQAVRRLERIRKTEALATGAFLVAVLGLATAGLVIVRGLPKGEDVEFPVSAPVFAGAPILAATARDLAGPLHRIAGTFGMVLDTPGLDAESTRAARAALDAAEDLLDLSDALGDAASLAAGRADPVRAPFDPVETVGDVLRSLETRLGELGGRAALVGGPLRSAAQQGRTEGEEPGLLAVGDAARFVRLLKALIVRMLPLAPGATLGVAVRFEGEKLALLVGDSSAATLRGGAFETVDLREAWPGQDLSDGLSPAIALAEAMGGELTRARAGAGRSETVRAVLPFPPRAADAVEDTEAASPRSLTLLAVDDVPTNRRLLAAMLERHHHVCDTAADATEALRLLRERPYDAVLMDVQMPGTDGLAATRMIRALPPPVGQIPVIAVTAHVLPEQHETFRAAGMNGVIAKPVATAALLDELSRVVVQRVSSLHPARAETVALLDEETLTFVRSTLSPADFARFVERQTAEGAAALADAEAALRRGDQKAAAAAARAVAAAYEAVGAPRVAAMARHLEETATPQGIAQLREAAEATEAALRSRATGARQQGWSGQQATTI